MPTGYTAGILDGKITTFQQFAKQCMRAFGATIHMRDEDMDVEYEKRIPSDYHTKEINKAKSSLKKAQTLSDEKIIKNRIAELKKSKPYHIDSIKKAKDGSKRLVEMLEKVKNWNPPTSEHTGIKTFMIDQIEKTIDFDCKTDYHDKHLSEIDAEISNPNAKGIRKKMVADAEYNLNYHNAELRKEVGRCEQSNKWVEDFIKSL